MGARAPGSSHLAPCTRTHPLNPFFGFEPQCSRPTKGYGTWHRSGCAGHESQAFWMSRGGRGGPSRPLHFDQVTFKTGDFETFPPPGAHTGSHPGLALRLPSPRNRTARKRFGAVLQWPAAGLGGAPPGELELALLEARETSAGGGVGAFTACDSATAKPGRAFSFPS